MNSRQWNMSDPEGTRGVQNPGSGIMAWVGWLESRVNTDSKSKRTPFTLQLYIFSNITAACMGIYTVAKNRNTAGIQKDGTR